MTDKPKSIDTRTIHAGQQPENWMWATQAPVVQSASHLFETAEGLSDVFAGKEPGHIYMRLRNPTNEALERRVADLEGGVGAVAVSSGMAAVTDTIMALMKSGGHLVAGRSLFMSTYLLFTGVLKKFDMEATLCDPTKPEEWEAAITDDTRLLFTETIGNPVMDVPDIKRLSEIAHNAGLPLIVDNTLGTPWLFRPIEWGADIVVHSTTKFLNGHGSAVGGVVIDSGNFDWEDKRFEDMKPFKDRAGNKAFLDRVWREIHINFGTTAAPWHSYLTLIGMDTLHLRMERHCDNAAALADFLAGHPKVGWVRYPGREDSASYDTAKKQFGGRHFGGLLTFGLGNEKEAFDLIRHLEIAYHLANLGDVKTLVIHPWSSQYVSFTDETRKDIGIFPELVRVSAGIEAKDDIIADFEQALAKV